MAKTEKSVLMEELLPGVQESVYKKVCERYKKISAKNTPEKAKEWTILVTNFAFMLYEHIELYKPGDGFKQAAISKIIIDDYYNN